MKKPNICFQVIVFNGDSILYDSIKSVYDIANEIVIAEGPVSYWQKKGYRTSFDKTNMVLQKLKHEDDQNKIRILHSQYIEKYEQCVSAFNLQMHENDILWQIGSYEIYKPNEMEKFINLFWNGSYLSGGFKSITFFGDLYHTLTGYERSIELKRVFKIFRGSKWLSYRPPIIKHTDLIESSTLDEHFDFNHSMDKGIEMYNYSYCFPIKVWEKIEYYKSFMPQNNYINNYFDAIYMPWITGDKSVEKKYSGVHELKPELRGDCYPIKCDTIKHPDIILSKIDELNDEIRNQIDYYVQNKTFENYYNEIN